MNYFLIFRPEKIDLDKKFEANLLNSTVYIISLALQITTFFVNYRVSFDSCALVLNDWIH